MVIDRRRLLRLLALTSVYPFLNLETASAFTADPPPAKLVFLLLHGMFFLEFDTGAKKLIVATPQHNRHFFYTRMHGSSTLVRLEEDPNFDVVGGSKQTFPPEIVQFKRGDIGATGSVLTAGTAKYRSKLVLPYPQDILPLRRGPGAALMPDTSTNVGKKLQIAGEVATITCLVYGKGPSGPYVKSFYAEHPQAPSCTEVNRALRSGKGLCGNAFDLQMIQCPSLTVCTERDDELPDGVNADDERGMSELDGPPPCAHPFASAAAKNSKKQLPAKTHTAAAKATQKESTHQGQKAVPKKAHQFVGGDVSSCPQFGIQP